MDTVLCLRSAWEYWHAARVTDDPQLRADPVARRKPLSMPRSRATLVPSHAPTAAELSALQRGFERFGALKLADGIHEIPGITNPVHILVATGASRRPIEGCVIHQAHVPLAAGSLVWIENGLMLSSPEHLYLQAAVRLDRLELTWFASELCSVFSLHPDDAGTLAPARPLTTLKKLSDYIMEACKSNSYGCKKALAGLAYAVEGAASRREIACALRMCVPRSWGGRGIPKPVLNYGLTIDKRHAAVHGWQHVSVDIAWPQAQLAMEYDSDTYHLDPRRRARDNDKRAVLERMGWRVLPFSTKQFDSIAMSDDMFRRIGTYLGIKDRSGESRYDWQARRSQLMTHLWRLCSSGIEL